MTRIVLVHGTVLALLLPMLVCSPALAEAVPRTIDEIVVLAAKRSAELAALEKETDAAYSLAVQAGTIGNPTLEFQGFTGRLTGSPDEHSASIGINQELPLNNKLRLRREMMQREAEALRRHRDNAARLLKDDVSTLALDYSLLTERRELASELVRLNSDLVAVAGDRFNAGDIPELDFNLAKVELARAESRLLEVERESIPLCVKIASLTGLNEADIKLSDKLSSPLASPKTGGLAQQALASRPDFLALALERDKAETGHRLSKAEAIPNLTAGVFAQWEQSSVEVGGMESINRDTQLGIRLSMPIPVFDRNAGGRAAARARLDAADSRRLALERSIIAEVEAAISRFSSSERVLALFEKGIIPQLTENLKLTREAYRLGEVGIISVIEEQKKFFELNDSYLSALHARRLALIKLETAAAVDLNGGAR